MLDGIIQGDCIEVMAGMPDASVDLVFADPPYNLQLGGVLTRPDESKVDAVDDDWDSFEDFAAYDAFNRAWLAEARRVLKPNGCIWAMGSYHNVFRLGAMLQDMGFWILNDVAWVKTNPMPNFRGTRFANAHETLIWAKRDRKSTYRFNYESLKAGNDDVQMRSDWTLPICTGAERLKDVDGGKVHPTQKPEALLARILMANSAPGDLVLDPFSGTGTTCAVAKRLGRRHVGIERDPGYVAASRRRLSDVVPGSPVAGATGTSRRSAPRIPFRSVIERGLIEPGAVLVDRSRVHRAVVRADGSLDVGGSVASIHSGAAALLGRESMNGWDFWHVEGQDLAPIEGFRVQLRREAAAAA